MNPRPPLLARRLFEWVAGRASVDDLLGDLDEWYAIHLRTTSPLRAKWIYWKHVLSLCFSYALRKRKRDASYSIYSTQNFSIDMLRNYFKIAFRNLYHYKYFSVLNIFGLALGMSVSLLLISIYSYVSTYDNFHKNKERIYSVISHVKDGIEEIDYATAPIALANKLKHENTGADEIVRIVKAYHSIKTPTENIPVKGYYVGSDFFRLFSLNLMEGSTEILDKPNHVVLTERSAQKLFNTSDVIGKVIEMESGETFQVGALLKDLPQNTHLDFEILVSFASLHENNVSVEKQWVEFPSQYIYVLLKENTDPDDLRDQLNKISATTYAQSPVKVSFDLQSLDDVVMGPDLHHDLGVKWEASGFLLFAVFAALILLPACFNYTNISIARALQRSKEIGLRKTMGGVKNQIFFQFITETVIITLISLIGSLLIFMLIRKEFQSMLVAGSSLDLSLTSELLVWFIVFALITGFFAGVIPALYFARLNPIQALKNKIHGRSSSMRVRKVLTVFQFALSFGFILSLVVFSRQYRYSRNFDFGFNKQNTVDVALQDVDPNVARNAFTKVASVQSLSMSSGLIGVHASRTWIHTPEQDSAEVSQLFVDEQYIPNFGLTLLAGENFKEEDYQQERHLIVNEEFVKALKFDDPREALGKTFQVDGQELSILGVVKNFHYEPITRPIGKFFFRMKPSEFNYINLHVASNDAYHTFTELENTWETLPTTKKFEGQYFEDELNEAYSSYVTLLKIIGFLGLMAITISLLGMLGMVVYTTETKTKEVSIRKVMGASIAGIAMLLSKDYLKMMGWAILFSIPVTGWLLTLLLDQMAHYNVQLSAWDILLSTFIVILAGVLTITSQTYKTAIANPADTLRTE